EYCRAEQPPSTAVPQQPSPSKFLAVEANAVLSSLQTIPEFAETLELIDSDPIVWSDVTNFSLSEVDSPMKQTATPFPHKQEGVILGYQFDGSAISHMSRNCSGSNGQMQLIPLTSPVVAKFSTPPSILRRKKKERTNHSPLSEGDNSSFMDTSGMSPRNTPVKSLPFSPSQFFNISGNENFNLDNPALTSTPVCGQKYLVTTPLQKETTPKGQKENAGFRTPKVRKSILAPTPRTPTPFKNALAAQEKKYGPLKMMPQPLSYLEEDIREVLKEETGTDIFLREELEPAFRAWKQEHDAPARKVRKSLVLDAWEKEGLNVHLFSQDQQSNEQSPSGNLLTCSLLMTPLLDKVEGRCSPVAVKEEPSITHQHSAPVKKEKPCMLRSTRFETPIQMNSEWETVVYGKTEDQLIMTEQARKYLNALNTGSTSRALVL
ncbi:MYBA protein, partial [Polyodon spathula]|nr:MYBA protein [Polyodon spathula]